MKQKALSNWKWIIFVLLVAGTLAGVWIFYHRIDFSYQMYDSSTTTYVKGKAVKVLSEELEPAEGNDSRMLGVQTLQVKILEGTQKGQIIQVENQLSTTHNVYVKEGQALVIKADMPEGVEPFYSVYNYSRSGGYALIAVIFCALMILMGRTKGLKSLLGLGYVLVLLFGFMIPAIYSGWQPLTATLILTVLAVSVSMILLNGFSHKTFTAIVSTIAGILLAILVFYLFAGVLKLDGYKAEEAEELLLISQNTGLQISQLLFAGTLISSLGALMDMTMSVAAPLYEIKEQKPKISSIELYRTGIRIGKDLVGTMCETLVLAFAGTAILSLLVFRSYGTTMNQLMNSDYIAIEVAQSLTGSVAVILAVPVTAFLAGVGKKSKK